ncbi:MAG: hypothetical protein CVT80_00280 [Alphaproteobacteria bacterium HGW-Alphaproteobacteria-2]|nr:MAG: hypothetical protein CVT80_00280 [Alphaproteobacteria bacterium HGW-Alphaproteobacteria-2]
MSFTVSMRIAADARQAVRELDATAEGTRRVEGAARVAGRAGAAMGAAMVAAAGLALRAFADVERQIRTTEQLIRATGGAAGRTIEQIERQARSVGLATLASTGEVRAAAAQLLTFRSIAGQTFDEVLSLSQDLAATGFGTLSSSAVQLAKALEDPEQGLAALRRVGVSFSAAQIEMIRVMQDTGRAAEAQALILAQVRRQVGGAGEAAARGTLAGAGDTLTEELRLLREEMGRVISESVRLPAVLEQMARGVARIREDLFPPDRVAAFEISSEIADLEADRRRMSALAASLRGAGDPFPARQAEGLEARLREIEARIAARQADLAAVEGRLGAARENEDEAARNAAEAAAEAARERFEAVRGSIEQEIAALQRGEVAQAQFEATRKAGVAEGTAEAAVLETLVQRRFDEAEAQAAAMRAAEDAANEARRQEQAVRDLSASLDLELQLMFVADPVQREMIRLRNEHGAAIDGEAIAIRNKLEAMEAERLAQRQGNVLDSLREREEIARLPDRDAFVRRQLRAADVQDPQSDIGRQIAAQAARTFDSERSRQGGGGRSAETREAERQAEAIERVFARLRDERDLLLETDPIQREMIRLRGQLTGATAEQTREIEAEIAANLRLDETLEAQRAIFEGVGQAAFDFLDGVVFRGEKAEDVLKNLLSTLLRTVAQGALLGQGPLASFFGDGGGLIGDILGGAVKAAGGGRVSGPGGPRDDRIPALLSDGEFVVNAASAARSLPLLEAINSGRGLTRLAAGGRVGGPGFAPPGGRGGAGGGGAGGGPERLMVDLRLSGDLDARIEASSERVAARVTREGIDRFSDSVLPIRQREIDRVGGVLG